MLRRSRPTDAEPGRAAAHAAALDTVTATGTAIGATLAATTINRRFAHHQERVAVERRVSCSTSGSMPRSPAASRIRSPKLHDNTDAIRSRTRSTAWNR
jgi:hypothetical protein